MIWTTDDSRDCDTCARRSELIGFAKSSITNQINVGLMREPVWITARHAVTVDAHAGSLAFEPHTEILWVGEVADADNPVADHHHHPDHQCEEREEVFW